LLRTRRACAPAGAEVRASGGSSLKGPGPAPAAGWEGGV